MQPSNSITLMGRLTSDPELKTVGNDKAVVNFTVAVGRQPVNNTVETDFINCCAWNGTAKTICNYFKKGNRIMILGELRTDKFTDKEGNNREKVFVMVNGFNFVDSAKSNNDTESGSDSASKTESKKKIKREAIDAVDNENLPF